MFSLASMAAASMALGDEAVGELHVAPAGRVRQVALEATSRRPGLVGELISLLPPLETRLVGPLASD